MSPVTRTALVTGSTRGLGRAVAAGLHKLGHRVVVCGRSVDDARAVAGELGLQARGVALDVTDPAAVRRAADTVGPVDILVCNAGVLLDFGTSPSTVPLDLVAREFDTNTLGAWRVCQAFVPGMVDRRWGRVVMVSSGTAAFSYGVFPGAPGYSASKTALNALAVMLAAETRDTGVLVNAVNPGLVRTAMRPDAQRSPEEAAEDLVWAATLPDGGPTGQFLRGRATIGW